MASNLPPALSAKVSSASSKASSSPGQVSAAQAGASFAFEGIGQRRSGGSGSFGAGANTRSSAVPRNDQSAKSKHKSGRRFKIADEDAFAESAAMQSSSSRKGQTSITHLMNFSLPPRPQNQTQTRYGHGHGRSARGTRTWGLGSGHHAVDKARYVHANYRFIVDPRGDYKAQSVDADVYLDWDKVLQILVSEQSQETACPICLGTPVAPRMAKCGHIFCLPCLIRYLHSDDSPNPPPEKRARWKKCPICWDAIYRSDTRPVRWYTGEEGEPPREGADVVLRLVQRQAGSTLAMPRESTDTIAKGEDVPWYFAAEVMDYARVMKGSEEYMLEQLSHDIASVKILEQEDELMFGEDTEWTGKALRALHEAKDSVKGIGNPPPMPKKPEEPTPKRPPIQFNTSDQGVPDMYGIQQAVRSGQSFGNGVERGQDGASTAPAVNVVPAITVSQSSISSSQPTAESVLSTRLADFRARQHAERQPDSYLFYQALLQYYLSPLDIRILKDAFGTYEAFPSSILPRIERVSTGHIVDDDLRKRVRYLAHLPYGCEVGFLECDWTDTVPPAILDKYKGDIERRRKRNTDKDAREEKERIRAEKAEDREFAAARRKRLSISNDRFNQDDFQPLVANEVADTAASMDSNGDSSSPPWAAHRMHASAYASLASPGTSPNASRTVWGTTAIPLSSPEIRAMARGDAVDDGWLQGWERDLVVDEELIAQVQAASLGEAARSEEARSAGESSKTAAASAPSKGKKKSKKITLMSTTARRGA